MLIYENVHIYVYKLSGVDVKFDVMWFVFSESGYHSDQQSSPMSFKEEYSPSLSGSEGGDHLNSRINTLQITHSPGMSFWV